MPASPQPLPLPALVSASPTSSPTLTPCPGPPAALRPVSHSHLTPQPHKQSTSKSAPPPCLSASQVASPAQLPVPGRPLLLPLLPGSWPLPFHLLPPLLSPWDLPPPPAPPSLQCQSPSASTGQMAPPAGRLLPPFLLASLAFEFPFQIHGFKESKWIFKNEVTPSLQEVVLG